jgi:hypothetical protein
MHSIWSQCIKIRTQQQINSRKHAKNWNLNNTFLNDQWVIYEMKEEIKSFLEVSENDNMTYQNLW